MLTSMPMCVEWTTKRDDMLNSDFIVMQLFEFTQWWRMDWKEGLFAEGSLFVRHAHGNAFKGRRMDRLEMIHLAVQFPNLYVFAAKDRNIFPTWDVEVFDGQAQNIVQTRSCQPAGTVRVVEDQEKEYRLFPEQRSLLDEKEVARMAQLWTPTKHCMMSIAVIEENGRAIHKVVDFTAVDRQNVTQVGEIA